MTLTGASQNMPFNVDMAMRAQQYVHPNVYPNAEYIKPPLEKKKLRVVEPATRTEISIQRFKDMQERVDELRETLQTNKNGLTYDRVSGNIEVKSEKIDQGQVVDISV